MRRYAAISSLVVSWVCGSPAEAQPVESETKVWVSGGLECRPGGVGTNYLRLEYGDSAEEVADAFCAALVECTAPPEQSVIPPHRDGVYTAAGTGYSFACTVNPAPHRDNGLAYSRFGAGYGADPRRPKDRGPSDCCVGNPVSLASGNKYERVPLYASPVPGGLGLVLHYNSTNSPSNILGGGWRHSYQRTLRATPPDAPAWVTSSRSDGKAHTFTAAGGAWLSASDVRDHLEAITSTTGAISGWTLLVGSDGSRETYDASGRLRSIEDRHHQVTRLTFSDGSTPAEVAPWPDLLIEVEDPDGRTLDFIYGADGALLAVTDPAGGVFSFTRDGHGNTNSVTFPDGVARVFHFDELTNVSGIDRPHALTGITDELGVRFATFRYGADGQATYSGHVGGADATTVTVPSGQLTDGGSRSVEVEDAAGRHKTYTLGSQLGRAILTGISEPCAACPGGLRRSTRAYDGHGNLTQVDDFGGRTTSYEYDFARNLETRRIEAQGTAAARTTETTWHPSLPFPTEIVERAGGVSGPVVRRTTAEWAPDGDLLRLTIVDPAAGTETTETATYDSRGRMILRDGPRTDVEDQTRYTYYRSDITCPTDHGGHTIGCRGRLHTETNALGHVTTYLAYDAHGNALAVEDPNGVLALYAYDARERVVSTTLDGATTAFTYDGLGRLIRTTLPDGSYVDQAYDEAHRLIALADNLGDRIEYTLDAAGRHIVEQVFDPIQGLRRTRQMVYDDVGLLASEIDGNGNTTTHTYDRAGDEVGTTSPTRQATARTFDALHRVTRETAPDSSHVDTTWNIFDRPQSFSDARGVTTTLDYDALARPVRSTSPDTGTLLRAYDGAGNLVRLTDAAGRTTELSYDALDRLVRIVDGDGVESRLTYDQGPLGVGRLTGITDASGSRELVYDARGRRVRDVRIYATSRATVALATEYAYDEVGRLASIRYPSGRLVRYARDAAGLVSLVDSTLGTTAEVLASDIRHAPFGPVEGLRGLGGVPVRWTRDLAGDVSRELLGTSTVTYTRDGAGRLLAEGSATGASTFTHDLGGRVSSARSSRGDHDYRYDAAGNLEQRTDGGRVTTFTVDPTSNRLTSATRDGLTASYRYDAGGNLETDGARSLRYDGRGRLVEVTVGSRRVRFILDTFGHRVGRVVF